MARMGILPVLTAAVLVVTVAAAHAAERVALIIGNGAYETLTPLANPLGDGARMAAMLADNDFDVIGCDEATIGCFDLDRGEMLDALEEFRDRSDGAEVALVFYAGHGMQTAEGNVLAPTDIEISCEDWRTRRAVLLDDVLEAMEGAKEKIVILDACRNDPFKAQQCLQRGARPLSFSGFAIPDSAARFLLVTSTQNGQVAQDGRPGEHSPFAEALFHYMESDPDSRFDQLFDLVTKRVIERTAAANFTQVPEILIRGGAPETCLALGGCATGGEATALRRQVAALKAENASNQAYEEIVVAVLKSAGYEDPRNLSPAETRRFFESIIAAGRALTDRGEEGTVALAALRDGDPDAAEALFQRDLADARASAERERKRAAESARHLAALARPSDTAKAAHYFAEAAELDPDDPRNWIDLAETALASGDRERARKAYEEALSLAHAGAASPEQRVWASEGYADVVWAAGRPDQAEKLYRDAAAAAREALVIDPLNTGLKRGLIVTHYNLGHLALDDGRYPEALASFSEGLAVAQSLAAEEPGNTVWRFDIGRGEERIGRARQAMGELDLARAAYERKHEIMRQVVAAEPRNPVWIRDLALADEFLGDIALAEGNDAEALARYEASLARMIPLRDSNPTNTDHRRFTSVTHLKAGDVLDRTGRPDEAREHFSAAMEVSQALVGIDPDNATWAWDLFRAYQRMASSTPPGTEWHRKALRVIEQMDERGLLSPDQRQWMDITRQRLEASQ